MAKFERLPQIKEYDDDPLSIFSFADGIGGILQGAKHAGIPVKRQVRAEVDPFANAIVDKNWKDSGIEIVNKGDINNIDNLTDFGTNFTAGGPPCQDFSRLQHDGLGARGTKSSLALKYIALLKSIPEAQRRFIMEETQMGVDKETGRPWRELINEAFQHELGTTSQMETVDGRNFSPMSRDRLWIASGFDNKLPHAQKKYKDPTLDYINYGKQRAVNKAFDPTRILNHETDNGKPWGEGLTLEDFDTTGHAHAQDRWHSQVPWTPTMLASDKTHAYPSSIGYSFQSGFGKHIIRANDKGNLIYDPKEQYTHLIGKPSPLLDEETGKYLPYYIDQVRAGNHDMIPGQAYEGRALTPEETEIMMGFTSGYTRLPEEQLAEIREKVLKVMQGQIRDPDIEAWLTYITPAGVDPSIPVHKGVKDDYRYHGLGNGWQTNSVDYILRRLFGLGGYNKYWSDARLKNIVPAVTGKYL